MSSHNNAIAINIPNCVSIKTVVPKYPHKCCSHAFKHWQNLFNAHKTGRVIFKRSILSLAYFYFNIVEFNGKGEKSLTYFLFTEIENNDLNDKTYVPIPEGDFPL